MRKVVLCLLLLGLTEGFCFCQGCFFRQYWAEYNSEIDNTNSTGRSERPRVGDHGMSTHPDYWSDTLDELTFPPGRKHVRLYYCKSLRGLLNTV